MRGYYGRQRQRMMVGAESPPDQGAAVPVIIMGGAIALLVAILRDERKLSR